MASARRPAGPIPSPAPPASTDLLDVLCAAEAAILLGITEDEVLYRQRFGWLPDELRHSELAPPVESSDRDGHDQDDVEHEDGVDEDGVDEDGVDENGCRGGSHSR